MNNKLLAKIKADFTSKKIDLYLLPRTDFHGSEYISNHFKTVKWLTNFSGSNAFVVIGQNVSDVWTDGRYFLQAENELKNSGFSLKKILPEKKSTFKKWIKEYIEKNSIRNIGLDAKLFSIAALKDLIKIVEKQNINIIFEDCVITNYWKDRPKFPNSNITFHCNKFSGESTRKKLKKILKKLGEQKIENYFTGALDEIAWILNLRGSDINFNPVFYSYLYLSLNEIILFIDSTRLTKRAREELEKNNIILKEYEQYYNFCRNFKDKAFLDANTSNYKTYDCLKEKNLIKSVILEEKAIKNKIQIENLKEALTSDSIALFKFFVWLKENIKNNKVTEYEALNKLNDFRKLDENYVGNSFYSIVGYKENGAIIHYAPREKTSKVIRPKGLLLVDSGGQYLNGTTDITRTFSLGAPTKEQITNYTLVLKGHIALAEATFLSGTSGNQIDILARQYLLKNSLNYQHGTGHGVGYYLNVHEGPQSISPSKTETANTALIPGMLISNEPGYYKKGEYGIRLENLVLVKEKEDSQYGNFLDFETLTLFPFDRELIDTDMLTKEEIEWLNNYHAKVLSSLSSLMTKEEIELLEDICRKI